jgi:hypothetical protein
MINATPDEIEEFKQGLSHLYWNRVLDDYIKTQKMSYEDYEDMNYQQKNVIQELKKYFKRQKLSTSRLLDTEKRV